MKAIKAKNPIPVKLEDWLREIATAYCDARRYAIRGIDR